MLKIREEKISNDLYVQFYDRSHRYFGDYNKITILVVVKSYNSDLDEYNYSLEHMAVPTDEIPATRETMINNYLATATPYLIRPGFLNRAKTPINQKFRAFITGYGQ